MVNRQQWIFVALVATCLAALPPESLAREAEIVSPRAGEADAAVAMIKRQYAYLIVGNEKDREVHRKLAETYKAKYARQRQDKAGEDKNRNRLLAVVYESLAEQNEAILLALEVGSEEKLRLAMEEVVKLEQALEKLDANDDYRRAWLTLGEVNARLKLNKPFKTPSPEILPFAHHNWTTDLERKRQ